jgi:competence protein ComFC
MGNGIIKYIKYVFDCVLNLVYDVDSNCVICGQDIEEQCICNNCIKKVLDKEIHHFINGEELKLKCISGAYYSGVMRELILKFKYKNDFKCGTIIGEILCGILAKIAIEYDYIACVPSSKAALKKRGYNQAEYIAKFIAERMDKKFLNCLSKDNKAKDQIGLDNIQRWINLKESFKIKDDKLVENSRILLVDDVVTTGATAFYCSKLLIKKGCSEVIVLTAAKSKL